MSTFTWNSDPSHLPQEPIITFGVELEFVFAIRINLLRNLIDRLGGDTVDEWGNRRCTQEFLRRQLTRCLPGGIRGPNYLGEIKLAEVIDADYSMWNLGTDASVGCFFQEMVDGLGYDIEETFPGDWHWAGVELVSQVLPLAMDEAWRPMFQQVTDQLTPTPSHGGFSNRACGAGLHVHVALQWPAGYTPPRPRPAPMLRQNEHGAYFYVDEFNRPILLEDGEDISEPEVVNPHVGVLNTPFVKNILILWAIFEDQTEVFHPKHRRSLGDRASYYANSLRPKNIRWNSEIAYNWSRAIYNSPDEESLLGFIYGPNLLMRKNFKIGVSPARRNKALTLEFREHRGTVDADEIEVWLKFIEAFVTVTRKLTEMGWTLDSPNNFALDIDVFEFLSLPPEVVQYFRDQATRYNAEPNDDPDFFDDDD